MLIKPGFWNKLTWKLVKNQTLDLSGETGKGSIVLFFPTFSLGIKMSLYFIGTK